MTRLICHQPGPPGAEPAGRSLGHLPPEVVDTAEIALQQVRDCAVRAAAAVRREAVPVERMIPDLRRISKYASSCHSRSHDLVQRQIAERLAPNFIGQLGKIARVMLVIMNVDGLSADVRCEIAGCIRKNVQLKFHVVVPFATLVMGLATSVPTRDL